MKQPIKLRETFRARSLQESETSCFLQVSKRDGFSPVNRDKPLNGRKSPELKSHPDLTSVAATSTVKVPKRFFASSFAPAHPDPLLR